MPSTIIDIIDKIVNPDPHNSPSLLEDLGIAETPSTTQIYDDIEQRLLLPRQTFLANSLPTYQIHWDHDISVLTLLKLQPSPPPTAVTLVRSGLDGHPSGYIETAAPRKGSGSTSTSLNRSPGPGKNFVRGKSGYVPFLPGGLEDVLADGVGDKQFHANGLRTVPPGFSRGLRIEEELIGDEIIIPVEVDGLKEYSDTGECSGIMTNEGGTVPENSKDIDDLLPTSRSNLKPITPKLQLKRPSVQKFDWAHVIDVNTPFTDFRERVPQMAHKYPFELDTFQKQAVYHLEMGNSVFVAAHTSAGKTVVAEYAIALAQKHLTRAIYTSPIKALSNQKFRDFKKTFLSTSVGILTGDVQINPEASCLIMTTEILRSMLYKGADLIRDVEFVIFDEVHYVNDAERGVVWEEVIIMLPDHVNIILLSATVPNSKEFADWVGRTKKKDIFVISTPRRPVPLEHYLYAGRDIYKIVNAEREFLQNGYKESKEALRRKQDKERETAGLNHTGIRGGAVSQRQRGAGPNRGRGRAAVPTPRGGGMTRNIHTASDKFLYVHILGHLRKKMLLPVVVFTFSKKRCEENAGTLTNQDLCTAPEKSEIHVATEKALSRLKVSDRKLPQIVRMRDLISRGIGIHHGGLLPLVKELVEILFARGLVKILFATETFAMGVNMPAKCVIFSSIRKHDGRNFRDILPGEYTQMAGRAGRRGLDSTGTVIIVVNDSLPETGTLNTMILGLPGKLLSQFRLTYNMILNLLRVEALRVEEMIKRSFSENASQLLLPEQEKKVVENERLLSRLPELRCAVCVTDIDTYYDQSWAITENNRMMLQLAVQSRQGQSLLSPGRVVILRGSDFRSNNLAIYLKQDQKQPVDNDPSNRVMTYFVLAAVHPDTKSDTFDSHEEVPPVWPLSPDTLAVEPVVYKLRSVPLSSIVLITAKTVKVRENHLRKSLPQIEMKATEIKDLVDEWVSTCQIPEVNWNSIRSLDFQEILRSRMAVAEKLADNVCWSCSDFRDHYTLVHERRTLQARIEKLKLAVSDRNLELIPDYEQRIEVLKDLKFIDKNSTVLLKGRVACEINSANELVLTELILENTLANYDPEEVVALLSCFVFQEKTDVDPTLSAKLEEGRDAIMQISDRVGRVQDHRSVAFEGMRSELKFGLVEVVYEWAKGMPFEQITNLTDVAEGTIVRVITRLDETCREVRDAARVIGDAELFKKMEECQTKIKRDIVFAASLYF